jgi:hypothetical protein
MSISPLKLGQPATVEGAVRSAQAIWSHPQGVVVPSEFSLANGVSKASTTGPVQPLWRSTTTIYQPFESVMRHDLGSGVLNSLFKVAEPLTFVSETPAGDPHVYFMMDDFEALPHETRVTLHYLELGSDNTGILKSEQVITPAIEGLSMHDRYLAIDRDVVKRIKARGNGAGLFRNTTRKVVLRGAETGTTYTAYYKFGDAFTAELHARALLQHFGQETPEIVSSHAPGSYWVAHANGDLLVDIIKSCDAEGRSFSQWIESNIDRSEQMARSLGRAVVAMYALGNDDFHHENVLVESDGHCNLLDLETLGLLFLQQAEEIHEPGQYVTTALNTNLQGLFSRLTGSGRIGVTGTFADHMREGAHEVFATFKSPRKREEIIEMSRANFFARAVIRSTVTYMHSLRLFDAVPHYTLPVSGEAFADLVEQRMNLLDSVISNERDYWDTLPSVFFRVANR